MIERINSIEIRYDVSVSDLETNLWHLIRYIIEDDLVEYI